jgi:hypothetical protein
MLKYSLTATQQGVMIIYDMYGRLIFSCTLDNTDNQLKINNYQLISGTYIYIIYVNDAEVKRDKFIIIK